MLFNSLTFLLFLPIVWMLYWFVCNRNLRLQNTLVVVASYVFYGWWDWKFLGLIAFTSLWAYVFGVLDGCCKRGAKARLCLSLIINLGILGFFKYYNFFIAEAIVLLEACGIQANPTTLEIILPVGISFYTFQALSYTIDVYRKQIIPTKDPIAFLAFVSFFPQLVAGPIERATNLLPQFLKPRTFDYANAVDGCRQMLWGFFKKIVIADSCAFVANKIFNPLNPDDPSGIFVVIGLFCFALQIYGDFSGYSDIAIGCSRLFGIKLMRNFAYPYFSRDIAEFWRRWHISLSTWFRDYLYIPLGGSKGSLCKQIRNVFIIFLVSGLWHGANWTFVVWGAVHACAFIPLLLLKRNRMHTDIVAKGHLFASGKETLQIIATFLFVMFAWGLFRAPDIATFGTWMHALISNPLGTPLTLTPFDTNIVGIGLELFPILTLPIFFGVEWINRDQQHGLAVLPKARWIRYVIYLFLFFTIVAHCTESQSFIYFQF